MALKRERRFRLDVRRKFFYSAGGEALAQVSQRGCGCHVSGVIQIQVGWDPGQPDLVVGNPTHGRAIRTR